MVLKTFSLSSEVYEKFRKKCKEEGINMSKRVEMFMKQELGEFKWAEKKLDDDHPMGKFC